MGAIGRVVDWVRQGYPQGVPQSDYVALLGILRRQLSDEEIATVAEQLTAKGEVISFDTIRQGLENHTLQEASRDDIIRVSSALAHGGWPLATIDLTEPDDAARANPVTRFINWIRVGYPAGVPEQDYQPLLALLHSRLPDQQVDEVCDALLQAGLMPPSRVDVGVEVSKIHNELPTEGEIDRVITRLHDAGWPVNG